MPPWAFCDTLQNDHVTVGDSEAHHLIHVLRLKSGSFVTLFDGLGTVAEAEIESSSRRDVTFRIHHRRSVRGNGLPVITMAVSPPKGDRLKWMVEKLTEVGVHRLQLLECHRSVTVPGETRIDKLKAGVVAACKQSRRPMLMDLQPMKPLRSVIAEARSGNQQIVIAHPEDHCIQLPRTQITQDTTILVGPEGGFTDEEIQSARSEGVQLVAWPDTILRIETAAIVFASLAIAQVNP